MTAKRGGGGHTMGENHSFWLLKRFLIFQGMTQLLLLGKFEYTGGPIFKVVLEC